jgi:2-iminobutanoate/2-iminopropanoate deaminase
VGSLSTYRERWKAPTSPWPAMATLPNVSGFPPFDPETGAVIEAPIERQTELVLS